MGSIFQRYRQIIILAILLIYSLAQILSAGAQHKRERNWLERVIVAVTSPPQQFCTYLIDKINNLRLGYIYLVDTRKNYQQLLKDHRQLVLRVRDLEEANDENTRLRTLLGFKERTQLPMIPARVISLGTSTFTHSARINKGTADGIVERMSVVTADGIVGHIVNASTHYADILLLLDPNSSIDTLDQDTRARGLIEGQGTDELHLEFVARGELLEIGHMMISSGLDGIYPKGLSVGVITEKKDDPASIFVNAKVKPAVAFSRLEEVMVITKRINLEESE